MKTLKVVQLSVIAISLLFATAAMGQQTAKGSDNKAPSAQVQQSLIALDKQWGEAGSKGDTATLNKILGERYIGVSQKGESLDKEAQVAATTAPTASLQNATYSADEYKFEALTPDVIVMTHRATTKGTRDGKDVNESHRSLHVFQRQEGQWQVVANAQLPVTE
jgi:hypothetical protein